VCAKTFERVCVKFSGKVGNGPVNKRLNFGGDPDHGYGSGPYRETLGRALANVCTVPVLLIIAM